MKFHRFAAALVAATSLGLMPPPSDGQTPRENLTLGFIRFMAYHEAGHLLMNQVHGINASTWPRDDIERYADQIAAVLLVPDPGDPDGVEEIIGAANAWLHAGDGHAESDPHAPPEERAYNIVCYVYGSDPEAFADFKEFVGEDSGCEDKFKAMDDEIEYGLVNDTDESGFRIELTYQPATPETQAARQFLESSEILEDLIYDIESDFRLHRPTKLVAMSCKGKGDEGTFHFDTFQNDDPSKNFDRIAICYELVDMWMKARIPETE
jgi:hypothetical protein